MEDGYAGPTIAGAVIATICFPLIALIVALVALGNQTDPRKRRQLRTWAWASGAWLVFAFCLGLVLALVTA